MALSGIQLSAGIVVGSNTAVDAKYGPYADLATAISEIGVTLRYKGLTVGIETGGTVEEYWWESGTADVDLVAKGGGGGGTPSGGAGSIQFSDGSAFASDSNLFWDNTNKRLGVGTSSPTEKITAQTSTAADGISLRDASNNLALIGKWFDSSGFFDLSQNGTPYARIQASQSYLNTPFTIGSSTALSARVGIKGSGSTSATTSLLVQDSSGTAALTVKDDLSTTFGGNISASNLTLPQGAFIAAGTQLRIGSGAISILSDSSAGINFSAGAAGRSFGISSAINGAPSSTAFLFVGDTATGVTMGANSNSHSSAVLDLVSTTRGFLPPRVTTTEKNAISSPAAGLQVYDSTTNRSAVYSTAWENVITETNGSPNSVYKMWSGSQAQYDALTPDSSTIYFIV
jgi:hypothetical protein